EVELSETPAPGSVTMLEPAPSVMPLPSPRLERLTPAAGRRASGNVPTDATDATSAPLGSTRVDGLVSRRKLDVSGRTAVPSATVRSFREVMLNCEKPPLANRAGSSQSSP